MATKEITKITAKNTNLPENMKSWKQYTIYLLNKMPKDDAEKYREKFKKSIRFWRRRGGTLDDSIIKILEELNIKYKVKGTSTRTGKKIIVLNQATPDDTTSKILAKVPSYKRMCMCILKEDIECKYMGF